MGWLKFGESQKALHGSVKKGTWVEAEMLVERWLQSSNERSMGNVDGDMQFRQTFEMTITLKVLIFFASSGLCSV